MLLLNVVTAWWGWLGVAFLFLSAVGEMMGGLFDVKHKLHGMAFGLGVPSLPIAALLIGYDLIRTDTLSSHSTTILISTHATWISLVIMGIAMGVMMSGFKKAGMVMDQHTPPPEKVPDGVIAWAGYTNRLLVFCYVGWLILIAKLYLSVLS